jgi:hypothetical protein
MEGKMTAVDLTELARLIHEGAASGDCRRQIGPKMLVAA